MFKKYKSLHKKTNRNQKSKRNKSNNYNLQDPIYLSNKKLYHKKFNRTHNKFTNKFPQQSKKMKNLIFKKSKESLYQTISIKLPTIMVINIRESFKTK